METQKVNAERIYEIGNIQKVSFGRITLKPEANALLKQLVDFNKKPIKKQDTADLMNLAIGKLKKVKKHISGYRTLATKPLNDAKNEIIAREKELLKPYDDAIFTAAQMVRVWDVEVEQEHQEAVAKAEKRQETNEKISLGKGGDGNVEAVAKPAPSMQSSTTYRTKWAFEILDQSQVPEEFKTINTVKINEAIRKAEVVQGLKVLTIPGIKITEEKVRVN